MEGRSRHSFKIMAMHISKVKNMNVLSKQFLYPKPDPLSK